MPAGGRKSSTWAKGQKPPYQKPKGTKHKKTIVKEILGREGWEGLRQFIENEGATKLIKEIKKLSGTQYIRAIEGMSEYVKPKLRRVDGNLNANVTLKGKKVTFE
jgi:hypothetical protein